MYFGIFFFVLNRLRVPNPTQILVSTPTLPPSLPGNVDPSFPGPALADVDFQSVFQL